MRRSAIIGLTMLLTVSAGMPVYAAAAPQTASAAQEEEIAEASLAVEKVNELRQSAGLTALASDPELQAAADVRCHELSKLFSHTRPDGSDWYTVDPAVMYGEDIAKKYNTAEEVVNAWMASPQHRANLMNPEFTAISISEYVENGVTYWVGEME